jgi:hypothetical protein
MKDSPSLAPRRRRTAAPNGEDAPHTDASSDIAEADGLLMSVVRDLLYVEDRTSDLPLRQLHVCALRRAALDVAIEP